MRPEPALIDQRAGSAEDVSDDELARYFTDEEETVDDGRIQSKVTQF